jgi:ribbon-helix-helix CopG family protein
VNRRVTLRLSDRQLAKLDELAGATGGSRSRALQRLIDAADEPTVAPPPSQEGLLDVLHQRARAGSVAAIAELDRRHRRQQLELEVERLNAATRSS